MEGVILFADDHIHAVEDRMERLLFEELRKDLPVLGVDSLELAASAVKSIGSFGAIILDWQFSPKNAAGLLTDDVEDEAKEAGVRARVALPSSTEDATFRFLMEHNFYSLVYILSDKDVETSHGDKLVEKYGDRIKIKKKGDYKSLSADKVKESILNEITEWKESQKRLSVPIQWSSAINECMQSIFKDLSEADVDWIKEIYTSSKDEVAPEIFLVELLQLLLMEELVQHEALIESLKAEGESQKTSNPDEETKKKSLTKLFSRLHYSKLTPSAPVMTGDIFEIAQDEFGILITPECDVRTVALNPTLHFDLLAFSKTSMKEAFKMQAISDKRKSIFNPGQVATWHFLPSLPILSQNLNEGCAIDFSTSLIRIKSDQLLKLPKQYKLNSPFIQSLRQRYLAHLGRVGTPSIHKMVTAFHLDNYFPPAQAEQPLKGQKVQGKVAAVAERKEQSPKNKNKKFEGIAAEKKSTSKPEENNPNEKPTA